MSNDIAFENRIRAACADICIVSKGKKSTMLTFCLWQTIRGTFETETLLESERLEPGSTFSSDLAGVLTREISDHIFRERSSPNSHRRRRRCKRFQTLFCGFKDIEMSCSCGTPAARRYLHLVSANLRALKGSLDENLGWSFAAQGYDTLLLHPGMSAVPHHESLRNSKSQRSAGQGRSSWMPVK